VPWVVASAEVVSTTNDPVLGDSAKHDAIVHIEHSGGYTVELSGLPMRPYRCDTPDSTIPIAIPCGPNPYSDSVALFEALADVDISIEVLTADLATVVKVEFAGVVAGPYGIRFEGPDLETGLYWVQVSYCGTVVGKAHYAFLGSK